MRKLMIVSLSFALGALLSQYVLPVSAHQWAAGAGGILFLAGRIINAEPWAHGALRIQQTCMATGEAAGMMAARAAELGRLPEPAEMEPLMRQLETLRAEQEK